MMYVSVYPIAMSVRSTNVYEEKSLGIFNEDGGNDSENSSLLSDEERFQHRLGQSRSKVWGEYLLWHAKLLIVLLYLASLSSFIDCRQQLAFDMWWLALALWLICVIERNPLSNPEDQSWFNIFTVSKYFYLKYTSDLLISYTVFEIVSAYGTVGMSLGIPFVSNT
jgi:Trk-type K+ transport system membrane component